MRYPSYVRGQKVNSGTAKKEGEQKSRAHEEKWGLWAAQW